MEVDARGCGEEQTGSGGVGVRGVCRNINPSPALLFPGGRLLPVDQHKIPCALRTEVEMRFSCLVYSQHSDTELCPVSAS